jgi:hypothetical protein
MDVKERNFASFLEDASRMAIDEDVLSANLTDELNEDLGAAPTIPFDYLAVADELHSGRIKLQPDRRKNNNRNAPDVEAGYRAELEAYLDAARIEPAEPVPASFVMSGTEPQLSIEPEDIAFELGLGRLPVADYAKVRRRFAFDNHPDRVAPHLRDRAMVRMQIANRLIDDATGKGKSKNGSR